MKLSKSKVLFSILFLCLGVKSAYSQSSLFSTNKYISDKKDTLHYRQLNPDYSPLRKYPLIIFLHGSGERGNDNESQLKWGVNNFASEHNMISHPAFIIAPQCPQNMQWSNFKNDKSTTALSLNPTPSKPMELLIGLIRQLKKDMPVDTNRIYITGLSMGGYGTFDAIERYPHLFAAAVPVCGGGDTAKAVSIAHIPIWIYHGAEDAAVNPLYALDMFTALTKAGAHPGFTQYPEVGHFSWLGAYSDPLMIDWLFRQHK